MADVTGGIPPTNASPFAVPADMKAAYDHFGGPDMFFRSTATGLPSADNWLGRQLFVVDEKVIYECTTLPGTWEPVAGVLPDPVTAQTTSISGTTPNSTWVTNAWAGVSLVLPHKALVELDLQCWVAVTGSTNDYRADVVVSGATTVAAQSAGWGSVAFGTAGTTKSVARKLVKLNAGTNTIKVATLRTVNTTGTFDLSQATLTATPIRFVA